MQKGMGNETKHQEIERRVGTMRVWRNREELGHLYQHPIYIHRHQPPIDIHCTVIYQLPITPTTTRPILRGATS